MNLLKKSNQILTNLLVSFLLATIMLFLEAVYYKLTYGLTLIADHPVVLIVLLLQIVAIYAILTYLNFNEDE